MVKERNPRVSVYSEFGEFRSAGEITDWVIAFDWEYYPPVMVKIPRIRLDTPIDGQKELLGSECYYEMGEKKKKLLKALLEKAHLRRVRAELEEEMWEEE